jgi:hypothetical protein
MSHVRLPFFVQGGAPVLGGALSLVLGLALSLGIPATAGAQQQVYRSVDAQGNVSFSSSPPAGSNLRSVESIELQPGPSEADRQEAEARAREMQQAADAYTQRRQAAREEATKQQQKAQPKPPASAGESGDAEQWDELLVNGRTLTPEQQMQVDKAKRELLEAEPKGRESSGGDLYQSRGNFRPGTGPRSERE